MGIAQVVFLSVDLADSLLGLLIVAAAADKEVCKSLFGCVVNCVAAVFRKLLHPHSNLCIVAACEVIKKSFKV